MSRLADITLFLRVMDLGSISAAARDMDISVAVASKRLKRLERDLGVSLLHRTTRRLRATAEGTELATRGRVLVDELEALTGGLHGAGAETRGLLRVTAPASFGRLYVSPLLPGFLARHPKVRLSLNLDDRFVDLVGGGFDLGIRIGALSDSSLVARRIASNERILCASPGYLARRGVPRAPSDLKNHDCLILVGHQGRQDHWRLLDVTGSETSVRVDGPLDGNLGESLRDAAIAGLGISRHSMWHVCDDIRDGQLVRVLPDYSIAETGIYVIMPERRLVPSRVRAFVDYLQEKLGEHPPWNEATHAAATPEPKTGN